MKNNIKKDKTKERQTQQQQKKQQSEIEIYVKTIERAKAIESFFSFFFLIEAVYLFDRILLIMVVELSRIRMKRFVYYSFSFLFSYHFRSVQII